MEGPRISSEAIMIGSAEAAETRRQNRVHSVYQEIWDCGTSESYGPLIEAWEAIAQQQVREGDISTDEQDRLNWIKKTLYNDFGPSGVSRILRGWFDPNAVRMRAATKKQAASLDSGQLLFSSTGE
jgi:hypothetical protein